MLARSYVWKGLVGTAVGVAVIAALWMAKPDVARTLRDSVADRTTSAPSPAKPSPADGSGGEVAPATSPGTQAIATPHGIAMSDSFLAPVTVREVSDLLGTYWGRDAALLLNAADLLYQEEKRTDSWASRIESKFLNDTKSVGLITVVSGGCRASICRYSVEVEGAEPMATILEFGQQFRRVSSAADQAQLYYRPEESVGHGQRLTMYLFRLDPGSDYIRPLQEMLDVPPKQE